MAIYGTLGSTDKPQPTADERIHVGIKAKNLEASCRLEPSGQWNTMVTHRVRVNNAGQIDAELIGWLRTAYERACP
jgi:hypothetical protein